VRRLLAAVLALAAAVAFAACGDDAMEPEQAVTATPATPSVLAGTMELLDGTPVDLAGYRGRPVLIVNTASECGYTPQYEGLETLHDRYGSQGLVVLGFPSNDFGGQEPGSNAEIADFCSINYGVQFPVFAKIATLGPDAAPLYRALAALPAPLGGPPRWNFTKFLLDREGRPVARFEPSTEPDDPALTGAIETLLARA
jgi:glutathione peroxidase